MPLPCRLTRTLATLALLLTAAAVPAWGQAKAPATPTQLIDRLGVQVHQALEDRRTGLTPDGVEAAVAAQITALARRSVGDDALVATDAQGRTPLMLAVSGGYAAVVEALLADPVVRLRIDARNAAGETAWMIASTAPSMTLMACQPGLLTLERHALLAPYLRRMSQLVAHKKSPIARIQQALEDAGAERAPDAARRAWLARCPNASPELRLALAGDDLLRTLVNDALQRQMAFNRAYRSGLVTLPQRPPPDMRFVTASARVLAVGDMTCPRMVPPTLPGSLDWTGSLRLQARIATRGGIVEAVDLGVQADDGTPAIVIDHFRSLLIRTLAAYQCEGEHVFEQEFVFRVQ